MINDDVYLIQDTREQNPFHLKTKTIIKTLKTGDYTVATALHSFEDIACVERKALGDLVSCCLGENRLRFERELARALGFRRFWIVIEACLSDILSHKYHSRADPKSILGSIAAWECRYDPVRFLFAGNRITAGRITEKLLLRAAVEFAGDVKFLDSGT